MERITQRDQSYDALRGLIMVIMALDHASFFVKRVHYSEYYSYVFLETDFIKFFTRWISHLCAPGFFFLLGFGIYKKYIKDVKSKSEASVRISFLLRGIIIICIQFLIENRLWELGLRSAVIGQFSFYGRTPGSGSGEVFMGVLFALGISLIVLGLVIHKRPIVLPLIGVFLIILTQVIIMNTGTSSDLSVFTRILFIPGISGSYHVLYSIMPLLGVSLIGVYVGFLHSVEKEPNYLLLGLCMLLSFVVLRYFRLFGDTNQFSRGIYSFLTVTKYPASLHFLLVTLGIDSILLYAFKKIDSGLKLFLSVYGREPLLFYILHLVLYYIISLGFDRPSSYLGLYLIWIIGVVVLYYPCILYNSIKTNNTTE